MKIDLKISNREKMMLIVLGVIMVIGVYYKFVYSKQISQIAELTAQQEENQGKINSMEQNKVLSEKLKKDIKIINAKILESTEEFFPSIIEEKILVILDDMINRTNIQCDSISVSEAADEVLEEKKEEGKPLNTLETMVEQYKALEDNKNELNLGESGEKKETDAGTDNKDKDKKAAEVKKTSIALSINGNYDDIMRFIDEVKGFYKRIVIKNISLIADGDKLSGNMILDFYAVPKFVEEDIDYNKWNYDGSYGKNNIFQDNSGGSVNYTQAVNKTVNQAAETTASNATTEQDFLMKVSPFSSDLPTIMLGKAKDSKKSTYVYADSSGIENVEINFIEKDGKYYYKYKTKSDSYPKDFSKEQEFQPYANNINMKIYSYRRNSQTDMSGANIKIYNDTSLKLKVFIEDDDVNRPRVNILKQGGNIEVIRR